MKWQKFWHAKRCALIVLFFPACFFDKMVPTIPIELDRFEHSFYETEQTTSIEALDELLRSHPEASSFEDAIHILKARLFTQQKAYAEATEEWWKALETAQKNFGRLAFKGLILAAANSSAELQTPEHFVEWLRLRAKEQKTGIYLEKLLSNESRLKKQIADTLTQATDVISTKPIIPPPSEKSVPQNDVMLTRTSEGYCSSTDHENKSEWQKWEKTLTPPLRAYWQAMSSFCRKDIGSELKIETCLHAVATLKDYPEHAVYQLNILQKLTSLYRQTGMRDQLIQTYLSIGELWESPAVDHNKMGISIERFYKEKIADLLWAARYGAMGESYDQAEGFALAAAETTSFAIKNLPKLSPAGRKEFSDNLAESYLIRASRIALEQKAYKKGQGLLQEAKSIEGLSANTMNGILWHQGLLAFLDEDFKNAQTTWEKLLSQLESQKKQTYLQLRTHFWLSKAASRLGEEKKAARHISAIQKKDPLSFYGVMTMDESSLSHFGNLKQMEEHISKKQAYRISRLQENKELVYWLKKAEMLLKLRISPDLAKVAIDEMLLTMNSAKDSFATSDERNEDIYLYLTRLAALSGDFSKGIFYTNAIAQNDNGFWQSHPEQLRVYFPFAYNKDFEKSAHQTPLLPSTMLSIARQESSFIGDASSPAGAIGLMQLMPQTAQRYTDVLGKTDDEIAQSLKNPSLNISIAAQYLNHLALHYKNNEPAIYAAYNAGEFAVDQWLKKRHHDDPVLWVEMIPFGETKEYVQKVWRNRIIYDFLTNAM